MEAEQLSSEDEPNGWTNQEPSLEYSNIKWRTLDADTFIQECCSKSDKWRCTNTMKKLAQDEEISVG